MILADHISHPLDEAMADLDTARRSHVQWSNTIAALNSQIAKPEELAWRANDLFGWMAEGKLELRIDREYPLSEAAEAHRDMEARKTTGKLLLHT